MNLISLYTAEATATGGRSGGRVSTAEGAFDFNLELPPELGGKMNTEQASINPEQLFACSVGGKHRRQPRFCRQRAQPDSARNHR